MWCVHVCECVCGWCVHVCECVCGGRGTHEYCALSKRKNVSKSENVTFQSVCICVCMCMCIGMVNSAATGKSFGYRFVG